MATKVFIEVEMDEKGAVTGVENVTSAMKGMDAGLQRVGQRGNVVMTSMAKQQREAREAGMLLSNVLGVQMPAGLDRVLARMPVVSGAMRAAFNVSVVAAVAAAVVSLINNFDELRGKATQFGFDAQLALARAIDWAGQLGDAVKVAFLVTGPGMLDQLMGGRFLSNASNPALVLGAQIEKASKEIKPFTDQVAGMGDA